MRRDGDWRWMLCEEQWSRPTEMGNFFFLSLVRTVCLVSALNLAAVMRRKVRTAQDVINPDILLSRLGEIA